ncbi:MAG: M50 family metallopeptidase [Bacillota bacterium]
MTESSRGTGAFRLFRLFGINVSLHWTWLLVALYEFQTRRTEYQSPLWGIAEYLSLFLIVLMHEFGHALACRSVGGQADRILLWPFGGIAFVNPPQRPGALLWSIAAGPLVNIVLLAPTIILAAVFRTHSHDLALFFYTLALINIILLVFNLLPIYPLDGGQIVRALLWFFVGQAKSLLVAAIIGLLGAGGFMVLALGLGDTWLIILALLGAFQSWNGYRHARMLQALDAHRAAGLACPACGAHASSLWQCSCGHQFDLLAFGPKCPRCGVPVETATCARCGQSTPWYAWNVLPPGFPLPTPSPQPVQPYVPPSTSPLDRQV